MPSDRSIKKKKYKLEKKKAGEMSGDKGGTREDMGLRRSK